MPRKLTSEQIERYEHDGVVFPIPIMSAAEARDIRRQLDETAMVYGGRLQRIDHSHYFFRWAYDLATHPALLDALEDLLGPELFLHTTRVFYKHPHDPAFVSWHQDGRHSKLDSSQAPTVWIALTESTPENGCLRVIPGTHADGKVPHDERAHANNLVTGGQVVAGDVDESKAVDVVLEPGEMSIHHVSVIHGSNPNRSDVPRVGFSMSYVTPETGTAQGPMVHARGNMAAHGFELLESIPTSSLADGVRAHRAFYRDTGRQGPVFVRQSGASR